MKRHKPVELIIDPASGQLSASGLCLLVMILVYVPILGVLEALGHQFNSWSHLALIVGSVAGAYGANSFGRVWQAGRVRPPVQPPVAGPPPGS